MYGDHFFYLFYSVLPGPSINFRCRVYFELLIKELVTRSSVPKMYERYTNIKTKHQLLQYTECGYWDVLTALKSGASFLEIQCVRF